MSNFEAVWYLYLNTDIEGTKSFIIYRAYAQLNSFNTVYNNHVSFCRFKQLKIETTRLEKKSVKKSEEISRKKLGTVWEARRASSLPSFRLISRILAFLFTALDFFVYFFLSRKKSKALRRRIKFAIKNIETAYL